jgi:hypothetical protein
MTAQIKFTKDGKKVAVVGQLNATQTIVQEIFVAQNGQEVPAGENFIVTGLLDQQMESFKEKQLRELNEKYEKTTKEVQHKISELHKKLNDASAKANLKAKALLDFVKNGKEEQLETLRSFLAGEITHFFCTTSYNPRIVTWDEVYQLASHYDDNKVEAIKLVSLYGRSNGDLSYRLHAYHDGSGGWDVVHPCKSYEEALKYAQDFLNNEAILYFEGKRHLDIIKWQKIKGIVMPEEALQKYEENAEYNRQCRITKLEEELAKLKAKTK